MKKWLLYLIAFLPVSLYAQTGYQEQLYLHTDRTVYVTGETIWYSAYLFDVGRQQLSSVSRQFYLELIAEDNRPVMQQIAPLLNGRGTGSLVLSQPLATGRYQLRAYTSWMRNFDAALFYTQEILLLNPFKPIPDSAKNALSAGNEPVTASLSVGGPGLRLPAETFKPRQNFTIEMDSIPLAASLSIARRDPLPAPALHSLPDFSNTMLSPTPATIEHLPDMEGQVLSGMLIDKTTRTGLGDRIAYLSLPGTDFTLTASRSDKNGRIYFNLPAGVGAKELVFHPVVSGSEQVTWEPQPLFAETYLFRPSARFVYTSEVDALARERNLNSQLTTAFYTPVVDTALRHPVIFGSPDRYYALDLYTRFPTMEEVIHEFIPEIRMRKSDGGTSFFVKNSLFNEYFYNRPLLLVDGVPVDNADDILRLDPLKIKSISVYTRKMFIGPEAREGVVVWKTYKGDLNGYSVGKNDMVIQYSGLSSAGNFVAPQYGGASAPSPRIPDRRVLLYWNGLLERQGNKIQVSTSDLPGKYLIRLEGISRSGRFFRVEKELTVE